MSNGRSFGGRCGRRAAGAVGLVFALLAGPSGAQTTGGPPGVLLIRSASDDAGKRHEQRLFDELALTLDGFMLQSQQAEAKAFSDLPFAQQVAAVLPMAERDGAMAVVWLSFPLATQMMLHLVALGSGRAFIRTIEIDKSARSEPTLALVTRELLGTAYLFDPPDRLPREVEAVVSAVKQQLEPPPPLHEARPWTLWGEVSTPLPLAGSAFPAPSAFARVELERLLPLQFAVALGLSGGYGTLPRPAAGGASMRWVGGDATLWRSFQLSSLEFGPYAIAAVHSAGFAVGDQFLSLALPRFGVGVRLKAAARRTALRLGVALCASPFGAQLAEAQNVVFRTPWLELFISAGVGWSL